jgi:hypothetical protein
MKDMLSILVHRHIMLTPDLKRGFSLSTKGMRHPSFHCICIGTHGDTLKSNVLISRLFTAWFIEGVISPVTS